MQEPIFNEDDFPDGETWSPFALTVLGCIILLLLIMILGHLLNKLMEHG